MNIQKKGIHLPQDASIADFAGPQRIVHFIDGQLASRVQERQSEYQISLSFRDEILRAALKAGIPR